MDAILPGSSFSTGTLMARLFLTALMILPMHRSLNAQADSDSLNALSWLAGCWEGGSGIRKTFEQWMKPEGGTMIGMSRTVVGEKTREYEFIVIREQEDGIYYIASPSGQKGTSFRLMRVDDHEAIFENPEHDFPQRISYRRVGDDSLHARIEGNSKGTMRGVDFPMKRAHCP